LKMGPICCPETLVKDYHSTPHNIPEVCRSHQHRGGSFKSQTSHKIIIFTKPLWEYQISLTTLL
jgi:hypothetical protein